MHGVYIGGVKIDPIVKESLPGRFSDFLNEKRAHIVITPNPEIILRAQKNDTYRKMLSRADLSLADGFGVILASKLFGGLIRQKITGVHALEVLLQLAQREGKSVYFLGGQGDTATRAAENAKKKYPDLKVAGAGEGMKPKEFDIHNAKVIQDIENAKADIVIVAFGAPKQENWMFENMNSFSNVRIMIGVGGALDYLAGKVKRAPVWVQNIQMEWLYRLMKQPRRLFRIFRAVIVFPLSMIKWKILSQTLFRKNVVGVIMNSDNEVLLVSPRRRKKAVWQLPQGGVDDGESIVQAALREMEEEVQIPASKLAVKKVLMNFYKYEWPDWARGIRPYRGQKQSAVIFEYTQTKELDLRGSEEISQYRWVDLSNVVHVLAPIRKEMGAMLLEKIQKENL